MLQARRAVLTRRDASSNAERSWRRGVVEEARMVGHAVTPACPGVEPRENLTRGVEENIGSEPHPRLARLLVPGAVKMWSPASEDVHFEIHPCRHVGRGRALQHRADGRRRTLSGEVPDPLVALAATRALTVRF
jgi:hypothetical protein